MGKIYVIGSQKGGVGKTTSTLNLAYALQKLGKKVLAVDFDSQANLTACYGIENTGESRHSLRQNTDAGIHRRHLHRGAFIHPLSGCASPEEKAVSTACSTVLGLIPGTEKPGKETHLESPSFLKLDIRKAPTFR